jgi:hypothetical protein
MMPTDEVAAAPRQLYGKSVVVSWSESRMMRRVGEERFRSVVAGFEHSLYVSRAGVFNRLTRTARGGTGSDEQIAGTARATRVPAFKGHSLTVFMPPRNGNRIRRITIDFDASFSSCRAKVILAKRPGSSVTVGTSTITGNRIEIQSAQMSGETCTIRDGNVFAGE